MTARSSPSRSLLIALFLSAAAFAVLAPPAQAAGVVTHTYDEFSGNGNNVGTFYTGFTYSGDDEVWCSYNSGGFPYTTAPCVILSFSTGTFTITANSGS